MRRIVASGSHRHKPHPRAIRQGYPTGPYRNRRTKCTTFRSESCKCNQPPMRYQSCHESHSCTKPRIDSCGRSAAAQTLEMLSPQLDSFHCRILPYSTRTTSGNMTSIVFNIRFPNSRQNKPCVKESPIIIMTHSVGVRSHRRTTKSSGSEKPCAVHDTASADQLEPSAQARRLRHQSSIVDNPARRRPAMKVADCDFRWLGIYAREIRGHASRSVNDDFQAQEALSRRNRQCNWRGSFCLLELENLRRTPGRRSCQAPKESATPAAMISSCGRFKPGAGARQQVVNGDTKQCNLDAPMNQQKD